MRECRTYATTTEGLLALLEWLNCEGCGVAAREATGVYWLPGWKILSQGEFELILANAAHVKAVPGRKTDLNDAMWIADLPAHGLIKASFVPDEEMHDLGTLTRTRKAVGARADAACSTHPEDADRGEHSPRFGAQRHHGPEWATHDRGDDRLMCATPANWRPWPVAG